MITMMLWGLAQAQDFQSPNSVVKASVGTPYLVSVHAEGWLSKNVSGELGVGTGIEELALAGDWALRWRPVCIGCGDPNLLVLGVGAGGLVTPTDGPWAFAAGLDLDATAVHWFTTALGISGSARFGIGPGWSGTDFEVLDTQIWAFGSLGVAF